MLKKKTKEKWQEAGIIFLLFFCFYLIFQTKGIFGGDSGDLVAAAQVWGIPHPPGYPLYTLLAALVIRLMPFFTPAWRVGLLSSLPAAAALSLFYILIKKILNHKLISLISTLTLGLSYSFWLYACVPEVFGLAIFFQLLLVFLVFSWWEQPTRPKLYFLVFVFGLSLSHHHTVLLLVPALVYLLGKRLNHLSNLRHLSYLKIFAVFCLGLLPYLYLPLAASQSPVIDWGYPVNFNNFFALISRSIYGTFSSFAGAAQEGLMRLFQIPNYFFFLALNISVFGLVLAILGGVGLWRKNKVFFNFFFLAFFFTGPLFVFYSSFPLVSQFLIGTFERFLLLSLPFVMIFLSYGILAIVEKRKNLIKIMFFSLPLLLLGINFGKMQVLRHDFFSDNLGKDILATAEPGAILLLSSDQVLFNSRYVHYALKARPDIKIVHKFLLKFVWYRQELKKNYPEIIIPKQDDLELFLQEFLEKNSQQFPVFSNSEVVTGGWREPRGLLYKYHSRQDSLPANEEVVSKNNKIWSQYQDLSSLVGMPGYHSFPLSVLEVYREARLNLCRAYLEGGLFAESLEQCRQAQKLTDKTQSWLYSGTALSRLGRCQEAEVDFGKAAENPENKKEEVYNLLYLNAQYCWKDQNKMDQYQKLKESAKNGNAR